MPCASVIGVTVTGGSVGVSGTGDGVAGTGDGVAGAGDGVARADDWVGGRSVGKGLWLAGCGETETDAAVSTVASGLCVSAKLRQPQAATVAATSKAVTLSRIQSVFLRVFTPSLYQCGDLCG